MEAIAEFYDGYLLDHPTASFFTWQKIDISYGVQSDRLRTWR